MPYPPWPELAAGAPKCRPPATAGAARAPSSMVQTPRVGRRLRPSPHPIQDHVDQLPRSRHQPHQPMLWMPLLEVLRALTTRDWFPDGKLAQRRRPVFRRQRPLPVDCSGQQGRLCPDGSQSRPAPGISDLGSVYRQRDAAITDAEQREVGQRPAHTAGSHQPVQRRVQGTVPVPHLMREGNLYQRPDRAIGAQHRFGQLEEYVCSGVRLS